MDEAIINTVFQPKPSKQETKADATTRAAREILDSEASARESKTERLRQARLTEEAKAKPVEAPVKKKRRPKA